MLFTPFLKRFQRLSVCFTGAVFYLESFFTDVVSFRSFLDNLVSALRAHCSEGEAREKKRNGKGRILSTLMSGKLN